MKLTKAIESFHMLGEEIRKYLANTSAYPDWEATIKAEEQQNAWFTRDNILLALTQLSPWLNKEVLTKWLSKYKIPEENKKPISVGVVMAGNIPLVGFHDMLCVLLTGNSLKAKLSHTDIELMKFIVNKLIEIEPKWNEEERIRILFNKIGKMSDFDAVIATGSNNSAKHFEYYFKAVPHIIRKNRNGVAVLNGKESEVELIKLGEDIFTYFGLGCRNVSKLYVPKDYDFAAFFRSIEKFGPIINHHKYANNYLYNRTIYLMDGKVFTDNNFLMVIENTAIPSPIAVVHFEHYKDLKSLGKTLLTEFENIQCIAASDSVHKDLQKHTPLPLVNLGQTQSPGLQDYADGVDVIKFLLKQNN